MVDYDEAGSIGKRYRRQDEVGTPLCITVDFQTAGDSTTPADNCVTVRDRDTMEQVRIPIDSFAAILRKKPHFKLSPAAGGPRCVSQRGPLFLLSVQASTSCGKRTPHCLRRPSARAITRQLASCGISGHSHRPCSMARLQANISYS